MNIETTFWEETARLMQEYRKEGNEQRVQGIVDCRILFNRLTEQLRKHNVSSALPLKCTCGQNQLPYRAHTEKYCCSRCGNDC